MIVYYSIVKKNKKYLNLSETSQAQIVLKKMLELLDIKIPQIYRSSNGKPYFKDLDLFFNYSHSKKYIACAISQREVGIDVEDSDRTISDLVANKYLDGVKEYKDRIKAWVKKESFSKLKGNGLLMGLEKINLDNIKEKNITIDNKEYSCSIYCDSLNTIFKEITIN